VGDRGHRDGRASVLPEGGWCIDQTSRIEDVVTRIVSGDIGAELQLTSVDVVGAVVLFLIPAIQESFCTLC
jgi:hypothetical protein